MNNLDNLTAEELELIRTGKTYKRPWYVRLKEKVETWWMNIDAAIIMWRVNRDPICRNAVPPEGMYEELMKMIREYEMQKEDSQ